MINQLNIGMRVERTEAEGPGWRYALWVQGCPMRCPGCCNPHLLEFRDAEWCTVDEEIDRIRHVDEIEGVTFLGGEPFSQAGALALLASKVRDRGLSVMVFSGYTLKELRKAEREDYAALLAQTDLLVDGQYNRRLHVTNRRWIGSSNQVAHFLTDRYRHLSDHVDGWDPGANTIELTLTGTQLTINGFPSEDVTEWLATQKPEAAD